MSCVHYKFKSSLDYDTLKFEGLHITLADLKKAIIQQKKLGKATDFDLQIINAQTKEEYGSNEDLIPRNASVIIARVPIGGKPWEDSQMDTGSKAKALKMSLDRLRKTADLVSADATEEDKIRAMMSQSTKDYDQANYVKPAYPTGPPPPGYVCFRCGKTGHFIQGCSLPKLERHHEMELTRIKRSSGIPNSFLTIVDDPTVRGAVMTSSGRLAVPTIDAVAYERGKKKKPPFIKSLSPDRLSLYNLLSVFSVAYERGKKEKPPFIKSLSPDRRVSEEKLIPGELLCTLCSDLLTDAVVIPCCGNSYCDECIRETLLDTEDHVCPSCKESSISPDGLIANKFLRTAVNNFLNETGYTKAGRHSSSKELPAPPPTHSSHRPEPSVIQQIAVSVSSSDVTDPWQESPLPYDDLFGLPPQVVKARQAGLSSLQPSPPSQHNSHSRHRDDRRDERREERRRDDCRRDDRRRDDRRRDDRHRPPRTPTTDEPIMSPPQMQPMQQQQPLLMPPQQPQQLPGAPMGMPPQQPMPQNILPQFNAGPQQNTFFSPPLVSNVHPPGSLPPGTMAPVINMAGPGPPGMPMPQPQPGQMQPLPAGAAMTLMPNPFQPRPVQPQPIPQMLPPQHRGPMLQGPMPMMAGPMPPRFRGPAPPSLPMPMAGPPGTEPRLLLPPTWGPPRPFPAPGPPPLSEHEFYCEQQRMLDVRHPTLDVRHPMLDVRHPMLDVRHPVRPHDPMDDVCRVRPHDAMDDFELKLRRYHLERRKVKSVSPSKSGSKSPGQLRPSRSKSRSPSHSRSMSRSRSRSRSKKRSRSRSKKRSRSRSKKRSRSRSKKRSRSRSKKRSRSRSTKRSRSRSKKRSRSRSNSKKRSQSPPISFGRSLSCARSSSLSRSCSPNAPSSRSQVRRPQSRSRSPSRSSLPHDRRRKRSRSPPHHVAPPGGFPDYRGHRSGSPPLPPTMPFMRGGKDWSPPPGCFRDRSPGRMKAHSPDRYSYNMYQAQPWFDDMYRYQDRMDPRVMERMDPRVMEYYRNCENYMREMQDRFGPPRFDGGPLPPWAGGSGRSPPRHPMIDDDHRARSQFKKPRKDKSTRHNSRERGDPRGDSRGDPRGDPRADSRADSRADLWGDPRVPEGDRSERERKTYRGKIKGGDVGKDIRVKKGVAGEEKAARKHVMPRDSAEPGSLPSHGSPHGKVRKDREGARHKGMRSKQAERASDEKELVTAVGSVKEEPIQKARLEGEMVVAAKKVRKSKESKSRSGRVKGSKKAKKVAGDGETQYDETTIKRPVSYPSSNTTEAVNSPKKARMEADTTSHEDDIGAMEGDAKVSDVTFEKVRTPEQFMKARIPEKFQKARTPEQFEKARTPEQFVKARTPEQLQKAHSLEQFEKARTPEQFVKARTPEKFQKARTPEQFEKGRTPEQFEKAVSPEPPEEPRLTMPAPELSKWERDDYDTNDTIVVPRRQIEVKRPLPRSVIESAEKVLSQKRMLPRVVVASAVISPPSRSTSHVPPLSRSTSHVPNQSWSSSRVTPPSRPTKLNRDVERNRKVVSGGPSCVQVTITSSSSDKHLNSEEGNHIGRESRKKAAEAEKRSDVGDRHRQVGDRHRDDGDKYKDVGRKSEELSERRRNTGDKQYEARHARALKSEGRSSSRDAVIPRGDADKGTSSRVALEKEQKLSKSQTVTAKSREDGTDESRRERGQPGRHLSRKVSVMDEASFEPDYNEDSQSGSDVATQAKKAKQDNDSTASSDDERSQRKKKKKHKHKHRKHKHKKHKHK